jgi:4-hydroxy-tetrahydrodipicolinate reductase
MINVGIIGITGRMGTLLATTINNSKNYRTQWGYARNSEGFTDPKLQLVSDLPMLFQKNDMVVDFSMGEGLESTLQAAKSSPIPLIICSTGWEMTGVIQQLIDAVSSKVPVVIAPNTSVGACLQLYLAKELARILPSDFDIDIHEKHHRHKKDIPSGTARALQQAILDVRSEKEKVPYQAGPIMQGARPEHFIAMSVQRSGKLPGEHEVSFTQASEAISINHVAFNPQLFADGVLHILDWLGNKKPAHGKYTMLDVLGLVK